MEIKRIKGPNNRAVRLHHPSYRNCMLAIEEPGRPYSTPYPCPHCHIPHEFKTHHLILDAHGNGVMTQIMYDYLKDLRLLRDLVAVKEVTPAPQHVEIGDFRTTEHVISNTTGPIRLGMNGHK